MLTCVDCLHIEVCAYIKHDLPICSDFADRYKYVVREKGEWIIRGGKRYCPVCGQRACVTRDSEDFWYTVGTDFCPNCGADMRVEEQNRAREGENDG